jgi:DNA-binding MarR family transcriptional regulator
MAKPPTPNNEGGIEGTEPSLPYVAARLDRIVRQNVEQAIKDYGVSVTQYTVLSLLARQPGLSSAQLARRSYVSPQSMNETLLTLETIEAVRRQPDPNHGRILRAKLTAKGRRLVSKCDDNVAVVEHAMTNAMTTDERQQLRSLMVLAVRNLGGGFPARDETSAPEATQTVH